MLPISEWNAKYAKTSRQAHFVLPDIQPYEAVAGDMAGKMITSRAEHREFLRRNNFVEVGNEKSYMTQNGGMTDDNPNLVSEAKREEQICQTLTRNLERMRNR